MKRTKKTMVELLKAMSENSMSVANEFEKSGKYDSAKRYVSESVTLDMVIQLLTNKDCFEDYYEIFMNNK